MQECKSYNSSTSKLFYRLFLIFIAFCGACIGVQCISIPGYIDKSFLFVIFAIFCIVGITVFFKLIKNGLYIYIILQSIFFWILLDRVTEKFIHISYKPESLIFALALVAGI